ncbi:chemotaxis protein CheW [Microvirga sp. GCM10011540]|uniref:chemotaxis protein CheW n=1 Tax=Microvirga sp. GCM10011540 TaxID=3317338 RepID=UPI003616191B
MAKSLRRKLRQLDRTRLLSAEERARFILDERTERLASRPGDRTEPVADVTRVLICGAGHEHYGIPLDRIAEILPFRPPMPVPGGPAALMGVLGRGGHLVSVIDLGAALGQGPSDTDGANRHLVLLRREQPRVALCVDRAHEVADVTRLASETTGDFRKDAVMGYAKAASGFADQERVLSLLDVDRLLHPFLSSSPAPGV